VSQLQKVLNELLREAVVKRQEASSFEVSVVE